MMALVTAQGISGLVVPLLRRMLVLPNTVARPAGGEFAGDNGDTITVRVRTPRSANVQASPGADVSGDFSSLDETGVDVSLVHLFDGVNISDEELSLELVDFASQVTEPQLASVATGAEDELAAAMNDVVADEADLDDANVEDHILAAREALSSNDVPAGDRFAAVSPAAATLVLGIEKFVAADQSGDGGSAIREAVIGRKYGFTFVESNGLTGGDGGAAIVFYHRSGFAFANRAPVAPRGAAQSAAVSDSGLGLRQVFQYNPNVLSDQSVVSTFAGAALVDADRVFKVEDATA
jgi:hypothetical protein